MDLSFKYDEINWDDWLRSALREGTAAGLKAAGEHWYKEIMPKHFEPSAPTRYKYKWRTKKYFERREKRKGGPLRYSGRLESMAKSRVEIRPIGKRVRVRMTVPRYIEMNRRKGSKYPNIKAELTRTTIDENEVLANIVKEELVLKLQDLGKAGLKKKARKIYFGG